MPNWTKKIFRSRDSRFINLKKTDAAPWEIGKRRYQITPAIRLYHPTLSHCEYWLPWAEVFTTSANPDKRMRINIDVSGHTLVAPPVWEALQRMAGLGVDHGLKMVGEHHHAPPLKIGMAIPGKGQPRVVLHPKLQLTDQVMRDIGLNPRTLPPGMKMTVKPLSQVKKELAKKKEKG